VIRGRKADEDVARGRVETTRHYYPLQRLIARAGHVFRENAQFAGIDRLIER
jgi:hypothetical protein